MKVIRVRDGRAFEEVNEGLHTALGVLLAFQRTWPGSDWYIRNDRTITKLRIDGLGPLVLIEGLKVPLNDLIDITHSAGVHDIKAS